MQLMLSLPRKPVTYSSSEAFKGSLGSVASRPPPVLLLAASERCSECSQQRRAQAAMVMAREDAGKFGVSKRNKWPMNE